jgi:hypothetical protein
VFYNRCYITPVSCYIRPLVYHITPLHNRVLHNTCYITPPGMLYNIAGGLYDIKCYITPCYITGGGGYVTWPNLQDGEIVPWRVETLPARRGPPANLKVTDKLVTAASWLRLRLSYDHLRQSPGRDDEPCSERLVTRDKPDWGHSVSDCQWAGNRDNLARMSCRPECSSSPLSSVVATGRLIRVGLPGRVTVWLPGRVRAKDLDLNLKPLYWW